MSSIFKYYILLLESGILCKGLHYNRGQVMTMERHLTADDYREHWQQVLDRIEDMNHVINDNLLDLEQQYNVFDGLYKAIIQDIDILSSLYSSYNSIDGREYILRLRALVQSYRNRYTGEGINFSLISGLIEKIKKLRDTSFKDFPALHHNEEPSDNEQALPEYREKPFRWVTFSRNKSWFITPYKSIEQISKDEFSLTGKSPDHTLNIRIGERQVDAMDLLAPRKENVVEPGTVLIIDDGERCYAADSVGQKVYASFDLFMPMVRDFRTSHELSPGRVRFMGTNHILIPGNTRQ